jgi:hypothetical protein
MRRMIDERLLRQLYFFLLRGGTFALVGLNDPPNIYILALCLLPYPHKPAIKCVRFSINPISPTSPNVL